MEIYILLIQYTCSLKCKNKPNHFYILNMVALVTAMQLVIARTSFDCNAVAGFALAVTVFCQRSSCVIPSTEQTGQLTPNFTGSALILVAISTDSSHSEKLSQHWAIVPGCGRHIVTAAQIGSEVLRNAWCCRGILKIRDSKSISIFA